MDRIVRYFIKYSISGNILLVLILLFGFMGLNNLKSRFFPETPIRNISINAIYPGASPQEIEESVVLKIEDKLKGITGIDRVTSTSAENVATIQVETTKNSDIDNILQDVKNAVDQIVSIPIGVESIDIFKQEPLTRGVVFSLYGDLDLKALKEKARIIERDILNMDGISKVDLGGFPAEELVVSFDENKLRAYDLSIELVSNAISSTNIEITGGTIKGVNEEIKIRARNKVYSAEELGQIVVKTLSNGSLIKLNDVAKVKDQWADVPNKRYFNGIPAVTVSISHTNQEDLIQVSALVNEYIDEFNEKNNDVQAAITYDGAITVNQRIDLLTKNGEIGFVLVFILLALFLHPRIAFWVALSIPVSFAGMFVLANFFGITLNVISLFGMITVIGILVDDGVVISENIYQHFERGKNRFDAAVDGTLEVLPAVFSAILTTMIVFSSFFFIDGRLGDFFGEMAFIVIATLLFSLIEGVLILPAHIAHSKALKKDSKPNMFLRFTDAMMHFLRERTYRPVIVFCLKHRFFTLSLVVGLFLITMGMLSGGVIKGTFFPYIEAEQINVTLKMPAGTPMEVTLSKLEKVEKAVWRLNSRLSGEREDSMDVFLSIDRKIGPSNSNEGGLDIDLLNNELRTKTVIELSNLLRTETGPIIGAEELNFGSGFGGFGKPVTISLRSENIEELREVAEKIKNELNQLSDLKDVADNDVEGIKEIDVKLKDNAYALGLNYASVMSQVRNAFFGGEAQRIQRGLDEVKIWVRFNEEERSKMSNLEYMYINTPSGGEVILSDVAELTTRRGVIDIKHIDGNRELTVFADVANSDVSVSETLNSIAANIMPSILAEHPNVSYVFEGQNREQQKSAASMQTVMPIILLLMFAVIMLTFRSISQTLILVPLIVVSFIGVAWGHYIHNMPISLFSVLGMIALIGILVNDSLVFVNAFNTNIKNGKPYYEALVDSAVSRFRPILLTSITTVAGLAPLILEKSMQAQFLIPMAVSIAYGLAFATIIILVVLPVLLSVVNSFKRFAIWYWYDERPEAREVEPAYKELQYDQKD